MSAAAERHYERRANTAEATLRAVYLLHHPDGGRHPKCGECGNAWPCRTHRIVAAETDR